MPETDISICSRALVTLGERPISTLTGDDGDPGLICGNIYPSLRLGIMSRYPWRHLMVKKELTRLKDTPSSEWRYAYQIPGEAIGPIRAVFSGSRLMTESRYEIFQDELLTDLEAVTADIPTDVQEQRWPPHFVDMMVACVAAEIALPITEQQSTADRWYQIAYGAPSQMSMGGKVGMAMSIDSQMSGNIGIDADAFVNARYGGVSW